MIIHSLLNFLGGLCLVTIHFPTMKANENSTIVEMLIFLVLPSLYAAGIIDSASMTRIAEVCNFVESCTIK